MRTIFIALALCITASLPLRAQEVPGCMDPAASNYVEEATISDGSCAYADGSANLLGSKIATLGEDLEEISGMIYWNGKLYGHEDSGNDPIIYEMDAATGEISKRITLDVPVTDMDWEDITQDETYIYIGDFGNNSGTRHNLRIFRIAKSLISAIEDESATIPAANIQTIEFTYNDQTDFTAHPNATRFDCEAMIYHEGNLHLFTKGWDGNGTRHYVLPATPGTQEATYLESFNTGTFRITSATKANDNAIVLLGYEVAGYPTATIWIISGFNNYNTLLSTGNKRKVGLGYVVNLDTRDGIGQVEGIVAINQTKVLISNEYFTRTVPILGTYTVPQRLYDLTISQWMPLYILPLGMYNITSRLSNNEVKLTWEYEGEGIAYFEVESANKADGTYRSVGKVYYAGGASSLFSFTDKEPLVADKRFYRIRIVSADGKYSYSKTLTVADSSGAEFSLAVMPNPFHDKVDISFYSDKRQTVQFSIVDIQGRIIMQKQLQCTPGRYSYIMDGLQGLSRGVYFLTARTPGDHYIRKIVR